MRTIILSREWSVFIDRHKLRLSMKVPWRQGANMRLKRSQLGFSLLELIMVMAIILVMSGFAVITLLTAVRSTRVDTAYQTTIMTLRQARQNAIDTRDIWMVTFATPGSMQLTHFVTLTNAVTGITTTTTYTNNPILLPSDVPFQLNTGIPVVAAGARPT